MIWSLLLWARDGARASILLVLLVATGAALSAGPGPKVGVLLVNHGSRSATWRSALEDVERATREPLLRSGAIQGVKTAFMEYTEPSIATQMKAFDAEGFTDVVVVPLFLTVSGHTFDDIPTILGRKVDPHALASLKAEGIERTTPRARTHLVPNLDFTELLQENVLRRVKRISKDPGDEGIVLIAYGDETYDRQWSALMRRTAEHVMARTGIDAYAYGWAGHIAHYDPAHTTRAVEQVLARKRKAIVIPVLVARDETFQVKIIGGGIAKVADHKTRVAYTPDSILPDPTVERWVLRSALGAAERITGQTARAAR